MFSQYYQKGMCVIPLKNGKPLISWSDYYNPEKNWRPDDETLKQWDSVKNPELAILCGKESQIVAIDIDIEDEKKIKILQHTLGNPKCAKIGSKGITFFFKYNNEPSKSYCKDGVTVIEVLSDKRLTTLPPSKHRNKDIFYKWANISLLESELTYLPASYDTFIRSIFDIKEEKKYEFIERDKYSYEKTPELQDAEKLVYDYCNSDCSREEWVILGNALRYCFGDAAFYLFDDWSSKSKKYKKGEIRNVWRSFDRPSNYGAIVNIAKRYGYVAEKKEVRLAKTIKVDDWDKKKLEIISETIKESQAFPEFYLNAPEHIKQICDWILKTSFYPQPIITLGGVMSFLSFLMGNNAELAGLKPNLYTVCLAGTGTGKDHIVNCIRGMAKSIDIGGGTTLNKKISKSWTSDTAIVKRLNKNEGKTFYLTDEMHAVMKSIASGNSNSREVAAVTTLLEAYSGVQVSTTDYADEKDKPTVIVEEPFVSIAGFSTPEPFFDAIGMKEAFNGFIGRLAVFEGSFLLPEPNINSDKNAWKSVPENIKAILNEIKNNTDKLSFKGKEVTATKTIKYGEGVSEAVQQMEKDIRNKRNIFKLEGNPMDNVIARMGELTKKYAIIASKGDAIELEHLLWAKSIAEYNLGIICSASTQFTDSKFDNKVAKLLSWIEKHGGLVDKTILTRNCKIFENRKEREEAIQELLDREAVEIIKFEGTGQKTKIGYKVIKTPQA